jgi:hypothetical protein
MRSSLSILVTALCSLMVVSGVAHALPDATKPLVSARSSIGVDRTPVCVATRLNNGICYWWAAGDSAIHSSDTFRVVNRTKVCLDSITGANVQVHEWISQSPDHFVTPTAAILTGGDCVWLYKGSYWFSSTASASVAVVSLREVVER